MLIILFLQTIRAFALGVFNWGIYVGYGMAYLVGNYVTAADIGGLVSRVARSLSRKQVSSYLDRFAHIQNSHALGGE